MKMCFKKIAVFVSLAVLVIGGLAGCDSTRSDCCEGPCDPFVQPIERGGRTTLLARTTYDDYQAATMSFEFATSEDRGEVLNDWDLLFGNDRDPDADLFAVNTVTDDRSYIVDLGPVSFCDVPETVNPDDYPAGAWGDPDYIPVQRGHTYLVRTRDSESRVFAAFTVITHVLNESVTLNWFRSADPDRFTPPSFCP